MEKISRALPGTPLQHAKATGSTDDPSHQSSQRNKQSGLVGLVNVGNSCYQNATLQALSNCPPFRQYFIDCHPQGSTHIRAADALSSLFRQMWIMERFPGHLSPRKVSSTMRAKMFRGVQQQDAQEFLRCLLSQIHEEIGLVIPGGVVCECGRKSCDCHHRDSTLSNISHDSNTSNDSTSKLVRSASGSPLTPKRKSSPSPTFNFRVRGSYSKLKSGSKSSLVGHQGDVGVKEESGSVSKEGVVSRGCVQWKEGDVFVADLDTKLVSRQSPKSSETDAGLESASANDETHSSSPQTNSDISSTNQIDEDLDCAKPSSDIHIAPVLEVEGHEKTTPTISDNTSVHTDQVPLREKPKKEKEKQRVVSIVSQVFEGIVESKVTCLSCKKVSVIHEPFHDLSLPIPGRKEMAKFDSKREDSGEGDQSDVKEGEKENVLKRGFCSVLKLMSTLTRDLISGPPTHLQDCLNAFFDACELKGENKYFCIHCKSFQNSKKQTSVVKLPEVLCIHLKRFRFDAYFSSKISRHITFPLSELDMSEFLKDKPNHKEKYNLDAVITHIGGAGGGHYIAYARNGLSNSWYEFNDTRVHSVSSDTVLGAEGYVLFYRKVPPPEALSAQTVDVTTLLPKAGTTLPSPDVCYLSRHWLHLAKYLAYPGPIFQHEYACHHGCVIKPNLARQSSMLVRREVWEQFQKKYGGGPLVTSLNPCTQCQEADLFTFCPYNLEQVTAKRNKEKDTVHQIQQSERSSTKTEPFLLSLAWVQHWKKFILCTTLDVLPPGPIDNTPLLEVGGDDHTYRLAESTLYRRLSHAAWTYFHETYGGGPVIITSSTALGSPNDESTV